jgi:hypothetical protein
MKKLAVILFVLFVSCKKEPITPGNYISTAPKVDTSHWYTAYVNGGVLPSWNNGTNSDNELVGTSWILTKVVINYSTTIKNDTLHFITNTKYRVGNDTAHYSVYPSQNNVTLTFQPFLPMNYMQCSTNQLGVGFAQGQYITGVEFTNLYNVNSNFKAWFTKL